MMEVPCVTVMGCSVIQWTVGPLLPRRSCHQNGITFILSTLNATERHHIPRAGGGTEISGHKAHWKGTCSRGLRSAWALGLKRGCRGRARQSYLGEFIALDDSHKKPESPNAHISAVGAVRTPKRHLCVGTTQAKDAQFVAIGEINWLRAGEAIA